MRLKYELQKSKSCAKAFDFSFRSLQGLISNLPHRMRQLGIRQQYPTLDPLPSETCGVKRTQVYSKNKKTTQEFHFQGQLLKTFVFKKSSLNSNLALPETGSGGLAFGRAAPTLPRGAAAGGLA